MKKMSYLLAVVLLGCQGRIDPKPTLTYLDVPTSSLLQAISIVDEQTIWISGHDGSVVRSTDGGDSWQLFTHPTGDTLQFRDVHGFDDNNAVLMSAGPGPLSRLFLFSNDSIWDERFVMRDSLGFLDCIDFWDEKRGIAYGDAIDKYPYILLTINGGKSWSRAPIYNMPEAGKGEGGFAASGTCVETGENGKAWIATGAGGNCRVLITEDYGQSWKAVPSPIVKGELAGNTSVSFVGDAGFLTGGDLEKSDEYTNNCAFSDKKTWILTGKPKTKGPFYGGALTALSTKRFAAFACGPNGIDYTLDYGRTWTNLDTLNYWAVGFRERTGFASGKDGRVIRIAFPSDKAD